MLIPAIGVVRKCANWNETAEARSSWAGLARQMELLEQGKIDCLVRPDARFVDRLFTNRECIAKVSLLCVGGDLSDGRLARLGELPNVRCLTAIGGKNIDAFLKNMGSTPTLQEIALLYTYPTDDTVRLICDLPNLRSLHLSFTHGKDDSLRHLNNHCSLEVLSLDGVRCDERLLTILQSIPHLRRCTLGYRDIGMTFEASLRKAVPACHVRISPAR